MPLRFRGFRRKLPHDEDVFIIQQIALMLRVGIPLPKIFSILASHDHGRYRAAFEDVRKGIVVGNTLERSMRSHEEMFNPTMLNLIRIGELRGDLPPVLDQYVASARIQQRLRRKITGTLTYPAIVVSAMAALGILASVVVFPEIERLFTGFELALPLPPRMVIAFSHFMGTYGIALVVLLFAAVALGVVAYHRFYPMRVAVHRFTLRLPVFGRLVTEHQLSAIMRNLGMLLRAGMPIIDVLEACRGATGNTEYRRTLEEAKTQLRKGNQLHPTFLRYPALYPSVASELVAIGEETGTLQDVSGDLASFYEERVFAALETLPSIIEPVLIFLIGSGIALVAVSILLPMYRFSASI